MRFNSIKVGNYSIRYAPFSDEDIAYPVCDKNKVLLEYVKGSRVEGHYVNPDTKEVAETTFILVGNDVKEKFARTSETSKFKIVDVSEREDLVNPKQYLAECEALKTELISTGKALKFGISMGGKSKPYFAIVSVNQLYNTLEMWISKAKKSEQYLSYTNDLADKQKLKEMTLSISGIDKASVEDLITL